MWENAKLMGHTAGCQPRAVAWNETVEPCRESTKREYDGAMGT